MGIYFTGAALYAALAGMVTPLPVLVLFRLGFLCTSLLSFLHTTGRPSAAANAASTFLPSA